MSYSVVCVRELYLQDNITSHILAIVADRLVLHVSIKVNCCLQFYQLFFVALSPENRA